MEEMPKEAQVLLHTDPLTLTPECRVWRRNRIRKLTDRRTKFFRDLKKQGIYYVNVKKLEPADLIGLPTRKEKP